MQPIPGTQVPLSRFAPFAPAEILDDYDGPRLFTVADSDGELHLACWSDADEQADRYVVVPTTPRIVEQVRLGRSSIFDALNQPRCWLCETMKLGALAACTRIEFDAVPRDALPAIGATLIASPMNGAASSGRRLKDDAVRAIIRRILSEYAEWRPGGDIVSELVEDPARDHFQLLQLGWQGHRRVHNTVLHLDLIDGKIWIQYDGTDRPVAAELMAAGIPRSDLVFAEHPPEFRERARQAAEYTLKQEERA